MSSSEERLQTRVAYLEAALYSAGRPLALEEMMNSLDTRSERSVSRTVEELSQRIKARGGAFEVVFLPDRRTVMRLRQEYSDVVKLFTHKPLLTPGPLKTLGYIAYNQPVEQSQVVSYRGVHVYRQLKMLEKVGLIVRERTPERITVIRTTSFFADYFGLSQNPEKARRQVAELFASTRLESADARDRLADGLAEYPGAADERPK